MAKPTEITLGNGVIIPVLYEDRSILAIDKPAGWICAPDSWDQTSRNLQLALVSGIRSGAFWAKSRNLRFLRFIHRLDAETTGILLLAKNPGAVPAYSRLFAGGQVGKIYLAAIWGNPLKDAWSCRAKIDSHPVTPGLMVINEKTGKPAETEFQVLQRREGRALVYARPKTGRTHQIRLHLAQEGNPVLGDPLYGARSAVPTHGEDLALRAIAIQYLDPFQRRSIRIAAPTEAFIRRFGFEPFNPDRKTGPHCG